MSGESLRDALRVTKALADSQRIRILMLLEPGELCVCQIVEVLGLAPSTVSKHLSILAAADLLEMRKQSRWAYYRLSESAWNASILPILDWVRSSVAGDQQIIEDRRKLEIVVACDPEELCRRQRPQS